MMRVGAISAFLALLMSSVAATVRAQPANDKTQEVVVEGRRDHVEPTHKFVNDITAEVADKNGDHQIAQLASVVCPYSLGLGASLDLAVTNRVLQVAKDAGLRTGGAGCEPNVVVIVADTGHQFLEKLHTAHPAIFGAMDWREISSLLSEDGPVHAWQIRERLDRGGVPIGLEADGSSNHDVLDPNNPHIQAQAVYLWSPSIIQKGVRQAIDTSFVVIDAKAVNGLSITQIADYAAMRTLAITRAPKSRSHDSGTILTLFDDATSAPKPSSLSRTDAAYLHALYSTSNAVSGTMQRTSMVSFIKQTLSAPVPQEPTK